MTQRLVLFVILFGFCSLRATGDEIDSLLTRADKLTSQQVRRSGEAVPLLRQAIRLAAMRNDSARLARARAGLGSALLSLHDQKGARRELEEARRMANLARLPEIEADVLAKLAILLQEEGEIDEAEKYARDIEAIGVRNGLVAVQLRALNFRTALLRRVGRTTAAMESGQEALRILEDAQRRRLVMPAALFFQIPYNYGRSLIDNGQYSRGFALLDRAMRAATEAHILPGVWHVLQDTADWYREQNDYARADRYYQRALAQAKPIESRDPEGLTRLGMARLDRARGRSAEAEHHCLEALRILSEAGQTSELADVLTELARIQSMAGNHVAAEKTIGRAIALAGEIGQPLNLTQARIELARIERRAGRADRAESNAREAVAMARQNGLRPIVPLALNELAQLALDRGDLSSAETHFRESIAAVEAVRSSIASPEQRIAFAEGSHAAYVGLLEVRLRIHRKTPSTANAVAALLVVERERVAAPRESARSGSRRRRELEAQIAGLQWKLSNHPPDGDRRSTLLSQLDEAERQLEAIDAAEHSDQAVPTVVDLTNVRRALDRNEVVLEYAAAQSSGIVFLVTGEGVRLFEIDSSTVASRASFFTTLLCSGRGADALPAGSRLSKELLAPALKSVSPSPRRIFVAAAGELAALPFAALPYPPASATPLLTSSELVYIPSLAALGRARSSSRSNPQIDLLAFSNPEVNAHISRLEGGEGVDLRPLPYSAAEIRSIRPFVKKREVLEGSEASEAALKARRIASYGIVHFATHSILDPVSPRRSAVILARGSDDEDGLVQPRDIHELQLEGQLVVLSGCETSGGSTSSVEGALSLARAFLSSGATAVVGTLADVEDRASSRFVTHFYKRLAKGEAVGSALRSAQRKLAGSRPYETSAVWAPWIVSGDGQMRLRAGRSRTTSTAPLWSAVLIGVAGALAIWRLLDRH